MKKERKYDNKYFGMAFVLLSICLAVFFSKIVVCEYDMVMHHALAKVMFSKELYQTEVPLQALAYPLYHLCVKGISMIFQIEVEPAAAVLLSFSVAVSILIYRKMMLLLMRETSVNKVFADIVSIGAVLFVTARSWLNGWRYYALQCAANPIHNPTTIFVRPFGMAGLLFFCLYIKNDRPKRESLKWFIGFSFMTFLSTAAKPSFVFVFLPAMGMMVLLLMVRNKDLMIGIKMMLAVAPTLILLVVQQLFVTTNTGMLNIKLQFGSFSNFNFLEVIGVSLATFPVPVLLFRPQFLKNNFAYCLSMIALLIGWLQMFFLTNGSSGDFSWGYDIAVQLATVISLASTRDHDTNRMIKYAAYVIFAYQVLSGILYMLLAYKTGGFWF